MNKILQGDCLEVLKTLEEKSINMCMTSPPYWALRDYGVEGQLGQEETFEEYINKLCDIFEGVKRVLRDDGTCWVNLGDSYISSGSMDQRQDKKEYGAIENSKKRGVSRAIMKGYPSKCLGMIPFRFAIEMVNRGWIIRNTIIWHKGNCMPSSVKDRFTVDFEYLFLFSKKKEYYFETQYEKALHKEDPRAGYGRIHYRGKREGKKGTGQENFVKIVDKRNKRTVWAINPKPFKESHFAVYPEELCETPIKAGCPEFVCVKCGNPKIEEFKINYGNKPKYQEWLKRRNSNSKYKGKQPLTEKGYGSEIFAYRKEVWKFDAHNGNIPRERIVKPTCDCNDKFKPGTVLDPFFGAGTTGVVALKQGKKFLGIELSEEYIKIAEERLKPYLEQRRLF